MKDVMLSGNAPKRNLIVEISASLLLIFFVHTLTNTYIQLQSLKNLLVFYTKYTTEVAWSMLIMELTVTVLLFVKKTRQIAFILTILISSFAGYIILSKPHFPHAFGGILNNLTPNQHLIVYSLLLITSIIGIWLMRKKEKPKPIAESQTIVFT